MPIDITISELTSPNSTSSIMTYFSTLNSITPIDCQTSGYIVPTFPTLDPSILFPENKHLISISEPTDSFDAMLPTENTVLRNSPISTRKRIAIEDIKTCAGIFNLKYVLIF